MNEFVLVVDFEVKDGTAEQAIALVSENARNSVENEPGCLQFDVMQAADNPNRILLFEVYKDQAAFEAHGKTEHIKAFLEKARPLFVKTTMHRGARKAHPVKT